MQNLNLKGLPMQINMDMGIMKMTMEATAFSKDINPTMFEAPKGEYKEMSPDDLKNMGLDGFGF